MINHHNSTLVRRCRPSLMMGDEQHFASTSTVRPEAEISRPHGS